MHVTMCIIYNLMLFRCLCFVPSDLEHELADLQHDLSDGRTLVDVAQEKVNYLTDVFLPRLELLNKQQDDSASTYEKQVSWL